MSRGLGREGLCKSRLMRRVVRAGLNHLGSEDDGGDSVGSGHSGAFNKIIYQSKIHVA